MVSRTEIVAVNGILSYPTTVAGLMRRDMGRPYVVSLHGGLLPRAAAMRAWRKKIFYQMFVRQILIGASIIHACWMKCDFFCFEIRSRGNNGISD